MAGSLNKVQLIGRVGKPPEIRQTQNGNRVASFSVATTDTWKDKASGEKREATEWHNVVVWGDSLCNVIERYVEKGDLLYIEGALKTRKWQDKLGNDRYSTEVVLQGFDSKLTMLGSAKGGGGGQQAPERQRSQPAYGLESQSEPGRAKWEEKTLDDEIPF